MKNKHSQVVQNLKDNIIPLIVAAFIIGFVVYCFHGAWIAGKENTIANGARYSTLTILKTKEQKGEVFYYLGDEKHEIEVSQYYYDRAIKAYQKSQEINQHD